MRDKRCDYKTCQTQDSLRGAFSSQSANHWAEGYPRAAHFIVLVDDNRAMWRPLAKNTTARSPILIHTSGSHHRALASTGQYWPVASAHENASCFFFRSPLFCSISLILRSSGGTAAKTDPAPSIPMKGSRVLRRFTGRLTLFGRRVIPHSRDRRLCR